MKQLGIKLHELQQITRIFIRAIRYYLSYSLLSIAFLFLFSPRANALDVTVSSGTSSALQTAINTVKAAGGGTVFIPAGDFQLSSTVNMAAGVNIIGAGIGKTILHNTASFSFRPSSQVTGPIRISGISFIGTGAIAFTSVVDFRIDHCYFESTKDNVYMVNLGSFYGYPQTRGVVDHCEIFDPYTNMYGIDCGARVWPAGERSISVLGSAEAVFIEDCYIHNLGGSGHPAAAFNGAHYVVRHSTVVDSFTIDGHGHNNPGFLNDGDKQNRSTRCIEIYNCYFLASSRMSYPIRIRGGGGVIHHNKIDNYVSAMNFVVEGSTDWVHDYYIWENEFTNGYDYVTSEDLVKIQQNRDYWLREPSQALDGFTYTPFPYPHYLVTGDTPPVTYALTTAVSPSGAGTVSGGGSYTAGTSVQLTAAANLGYTFSGWTGSASGTTNPVTIVISTNSSVTANFTIASIYTLSTAVSPSGAGTVALSPTGIPIGSYTAGTSVQLTATAASGYTFTSWTGDVTGTSSPVTVTMNANKSVTAVFTVVPPGNYTLTTVVSPSGGGTVTLSPTGVPIGTYTAGTSVTLTAIPASSYIFSSWTGSTGTSGASSPVIVTMNSNKIVTATFTAVPLGNYTLTTTISPTGAGTIALSPTGGVYTAGTSVQLTATAATNYTFSGWTGSVTGITNPVTVIMNANKTVTATFTAGVSPVLSVSPVTLDFGTMGAGESKSLSFNITNTGSGTLSGSISTDQSWFTVSPLNFNDSTAITVTANTTGLVAGQAYTGTITITSTGGNASIPVTVVVSGEELPEIITCNNPLIPSEGKKLIFKGRGLTGTTVAIYSISGQLVRTILREEGNPEISWDGTNNSGEKVSGGIYLYVVNSNDKKYTGRIAVIR